MCISRPGCQRKASENPGARGGFCSGDGSVPRHVKVWVKQAVSSGQSPRCQRRWLSGRFPQLRSPECCSVQGTSRLPHLCPARNQQDDRNHDGRGPQREHSRRWIPRAYFHPGVVRAQEPRTGFPQHGPPDLGHSWSAGLHQGPKARTSSCEAQHRSPSSRPVLNRPWQLASGTRPESGVGATDELIQETRKHLIGGRSGVQPSAGSPLGRDSSFQAAGGGRVHRSSPEAVAPNDNYEQGAGGNRCRPDRAASSKAAPQAPTKARCMSSAGVRRAPGSEAPCLSLPALWNSMPRALRRCSGAFASFLRAAHRLEPNRAPTPFTWPCPLPYPEASDANRPGLWKKRLINLTVARLSYEHMGCPSSCPATVRLGVPLNRKQWQQVKNIEHLVFGSFFPLTFEPQDYGRIGHKVEGQAKTLSALSRAAASFCRGFAAGYLPRSVVVEGAPSVGRPRPRSWAPCLENRTLLLCPSWPTAFSYQHAPPLRPRLSWIARLRTSLKIRCTTPGSLTRPPFVKILADSRQKLLLLQALARSGRLEPLDSVPLEREDWGAGLFAVAKDGARDRLVLDARPANELEDFPGRWVHTLASAACLGCLNLRPGEVLIMCGTDLQDCFYQFKATPERLVRNHLACKLTLDEAAFVFDRPADSFQAPGGFVRCELSSLAMGDSSACEFAQCSHLGVLVQARAVHVGELLVQAAAPPKGLLSVGLVIDDLIVLQRCLASQLPFFVENPGTSEASTRLRRALTGYDAARLFGGSTAAVCRVSFGPILRGTGLWC